MIKKIALRLLALLAFYVTVCVLLYLFQEQLIFFPRKLDTGFQFSFEQPFEEVNITTPDGIDLNGVLFKADSSKGLIFYLHGNAGSIRTWGRVSGLYTALNYDVFILDYRGYGKSGGSIESEDQLYRDVQIAYDQLKLRYAEENIIVLGYSIGTGPASKLASENNPRLLILQAPFFSLKDIMKDKFPVIPTFILKYKFDNHENTLKCKMPIVIFHGDRDEVVYYESSVKLINQLSPKDTLITLQGQRHNGMTENDDYIRAIKSIL